MAVSLGASINQDGLLIAASALAAALASRGPEEGHARLGAAVLICAVATVKLPYLVLGAMLLLPLSGGWRPFRAKFGPLVLAALPALAWTGYAMWAIATPVPWPPYPAGPLWPGPPGTTFEGTNPAAQLGVLGAEPLRAVILPFHTIATDFWLASETVGVLGWLVIPLPRWLYAVWAVAAGCAIGADGLERPRAAGALGGCGPARARRPGRGRADLPVAIPCMDAGRGRTDRRAAGALPAPAPAHAGPGRARVLRPPGVGSAQRCARPRSRRRSPGWPSCRASSSPRSI